MRAYKQTVVVRRKYTLDSIYGVVSRGVNWNADPVIQLGLSNTGYQVIRRFIKSFPKNKVMFDET